MNKDNIYLAARHEAAQRDPLCRSRERAAERVHVSTEALADYEHGRTVPPCDVVASMCAAYGAPALRHQHIRQHCPLMQEGLPESSSLMRAALGWITALGSAESIGRAFAALAMDGVIDQDELVAAAAVRAKAVEMMQIMQETISAIDTALARSDED